MRPRVRIVGARGDWTAEVEGRRLAVLHTTWWSPPHDYHDPMTGAPIDGKRYKAFSDALRAYDEVVIQRDRAKGDFARVGYVGVFRFKDLMIGVDGSVSLTITDWIADPA